MFAGLEEYWALAVASVLITALALQALWRMHSRSPRALLRRALHELDDKRRQRAAALRRARSARRRCESLETRSRSIRPVKLAEARDGLSDAEALLKIAHDQVLVAENHVRRVIVDQFPPNRQEKLRLRYRVDAAASNKPFTF